jgi:hypothetical protein
MFVNPLCAVFLVLVSSTAATPANLSLQQIHDQAMLNKAAISSVKVEHTVDFQKLGDSPAEQNIVSVPKSHVTYLWKGRLRCSIRKGIDGTVDGAPGTTILSDGEVTAEGRAKPGEDGWETTQTILHGGYHTANNEAWYVIHALNIPCSPQIIADPVEYWVYPECLLLKDRETGANRYRVRPVQEERDGAMCHVVEGPHELLWVDTARGCSIIHRERHHGLSLDNPMMITWTYADFVKPLADHDVYVPRRVSIVDYAGLSNPKQWWGKPIHRLDMNVEAIELNALSEYDFRIRVMPGGLVGDIRTGELVKLEGAETSLADFSAALNHTFNAPPMTLKAWLLLINSLLLILVIGFLSYRRWRGRKAVYG